MGDAVTGFDAPWVTLADHVAIAVEGDGHGLARRILRKPYMTTQIAGTHRIAQFGGWLEDAGLGCIHVGVATDSQDLWIRQILGQPTLDAETCQ